MNPGPPLVRALDNGSFFGGYDVSVTFAAWLGLRSRYLVTAVVALCATLGAASPALAGTTTARSITSVLRANGTLRHVNGSFYAHGYRMVLGRDGAPRFIKVSQGASLHRTSRNARRGDPARGSASTAASVPADSNWSESFGLSGLPNAGTLSAVAVSGQNIYVGGSFSTISFDAGGVYNNIAWWDGQGWHALGTGVNAPVRAIAVSGTKVYAGGAFTSAGGAPADAVAMWNGSAWSALGTGMSNPISGGTPTVNALTFSGTTLYAGGSFDDAGGVLAYSLAAWNGISWSALGTGPGTGVQFCVYFDAPNHCFQTPGDGQVNALAVSGATLYVGGAFNYVGAMNRFGLVAWNTGTSSWSSVAGDGVANNGGPGAVNALALNGSTLYVGGRFDHVGGTSPGGGTSTGGVAAASVAQLSGTTWSSIGSGANNCSGCGNAAVTGLTYWNGTLFMSGNFYGAGGDNIPLIGQWNGAAWSGVGSLNGSSSDSAILTVAPSGLLAVGTFSTAGGATVLNHIGLWNGTSWSGYGLGLASGNTCCGASGAIAASNRDLYAAGQFSIAGWKTIPGIAHFDGTSWAPMGSGFTAGGGASAIAVSGNEVFVGGNFSQVGGVAASNVAMWDGSKWHALGSGVDGAVYALLVYGGKLWVGGGFSHAGSGAASELATWTLPGGGWSSVGADPAGAAPNYDFGTVHALDGVGAPYDHYVVIGGNFSQLDNGAGGYASFNGIALLDTTAPVVHPLDDYFVLGPSGSVGVRNQCQFPPCPGSVNALYIDGTKIYVGGSFDDAGPIASRSFARYDLLANFATAWTSPGTVGGGSSSGIVNAITKVGSSLYIGGDFSTAGTATASDVASYNPTTNVWGPLGSGIGLAGFSSPVVNGLAQSADGLYVSGNIGTAGGTPSENLALWKQTAFPLKVSEVASPPSVTPDTAVTFTSTIKNTDVTSATGVTLTSTLPTTLTQYGSTTPSQGSCSLAASKLTCALGTIGPGASATVAVKLTPVMPWALTNSVSVAESGSSYSSGASASATVTPAPNTSYVSVTDSAFSPTAVNIRAGQRVQFSFFGPSQHSAFDASPLALFNSGLKSPISYYAYPYMQAGSYPVHDANSTKSTTVGVSDVLSAGAVAHGRPVTIWVSSGALPAGRVSDVLVMTPGSSSWTTLATGLTAASTTYTPAAAGAYKFTSRTRNSATGAATGYAPAVSLTAT